LREAVVSRKPCGEEGKAFVGCVEDLQKKSPETFRAFARVGRVSLLDNNRR
jgi:hypothetical protein